MAIFLSYARRDAIAVRNLLGDLERAKQEAWSESAIALVLAVAQARRAIDLPDPLPDSPAPPVTDLGLLRDRVATEQLSFAEQSDLIGQLKRHIDHIDQHATRQFRPIVGLGLTDSLVGPRPFSALGGCVSWPAVSRSTR